MATNEDLLTEVNAAIHVETSALKERVAELEANLDRLAEAHNKLALSFLDLAMNNNQNLWLTEQFMDAMAEHTSFDIKAWMAEIRRKHGF